jgi:hypothetical protein
VVNTEDAAAKARLAGIPDGAVIFLDWEIGGQPSQAGVNYCATFFRRLAELGFRPGMYCHPPSAIRHPPSDCGRSVPGYSCGT